MSTLLQRLRARTINARTAYDRAYWLRAYLRAKARARIWDDRMLNGRQGNITTAVKREIMRGIACHLVVTSTTGGRHAPGSYHSYRPGRAVDMAGSRDRMVEFQRQCWSNPGRYREVYGPANRLCVKNGVRVTLSEGSGLENQHDDHCHVAV